MIREGAIENEWKCVNCIEGFCEGCDMILISYEGVYKCKCVCNGGGRTIEP
jgi:hypothetical protein